MIRIYCSKADATLQETETLTAGMVNTPVVQFTFSSDWDGLGKSAIVRAGTVIKEVVVSNNQIVVPSECLAKAGVNLIIGVWGGNFTTELPTVWCACGEIQDATNPYSALNHEDGTPSNVAQMLAAAERAEAALDQIENANWDDVAQKVIGSMTGDEVTDTINGWLDNHPEATTTVQDGSLTIAKFMPEIGNEISDTITRPKSASQRVFKILSLTDIRQDYPSYNGAHQSMEYDSTRNYFCLVFSPPNDEGNALLVEYDYDWNYVRAAEVPNLGHANDIAYNPTTDKFYFATSLGYGAIAVVNADTLLYEETINTSDIEGSVETKSTAISQISYDAENDCYYIRDYGVYPHIYRLSADFQSKEEMLSNYDTAFRVNDYSATTIYSQGSTFFCGRFIPVLWFSNGNTSYTRLCVLNSKNDGLDYTFDFQSLHPDDESEGITSANGELYSSSYYHNILVIHKVYFNGYRELHSDTKAFPRIRYNSVGSTILDDIHDQCADACEYEYYVTFPVIHPILGGFDGYIRGFRVNPDYGWQIFESPNGPYTRYKYNGTWRNWVSNEYKSASVELTLKTQNAIVAKQGRIGIINSNQDFKRLPKGSTKIGTLPSGFKPAVGIRFPVNNRVGAQLSTHYYIEIDYSGDIYVVYGGTDIATACNGSFGGTYIIDNTR